jgi:hypothetical protein
LLDERFAAMQDRQAARHAEQSRLLAELAERLDFTERVVAQGRAPERPPPGSRIRTPI